MLAAKAMQPGLFSPNPDDCQRAAGQQSVRAAQMYAVGDARACRRAILAELGLSEEAAVEMILKKRESAASPGPSR